MTRTITYTIPQNFNGRSIENYLRTLGYSHAVLVLLKKTPDSVLLNGKWEYLRALVHTDDTLIITIREPDAALPANHALLPLSVCYEDEDILVIDKPAGLPIHPSRENHTHTLANAVSAHCDEEEHSFVFRCINRLDRDTTGLTIIAKNMLSAAVLGRQAALREINREYLSIAAGNVPDSGIINAPIARIFEHEMMRQVDFVRGEPAVTEYRRLAYHDGLSLVSLHLLTGRTHQIRVHMKHLGYPLIGDFLYHPDYKKIERQALHSYRLQFIHPLSHTAMDLTAPLPPDMACLFPDFPSF